MEKLAKYGYGVFLMDTNTPRWTMRLFPFLQYYTSFLKPFSIFKNITCMKITSVDEVIRCQKKTWDFLI